LDQIGVAHEVRPLDLDESRLANETPRRYVERLAIAKAQTLWKSLSVDERRPVLGADTTVALGDEIFGKPTNRGEGIVMLRRLSGRTHEVFTAVSLQSTQGCDVRLSASEVTFGMLDESECAAYWDSGEPLGKAGGYAVQGLAASFIVRITGSYSGIMGLPLAETAELLRAISWRLGAED
ncbi:MAG TPA: nucleoside triphosphate pyrophosphatase, partial [Steroidobacteraceae bacterium]|nr:nucleoside triphosphate pyrophosphatase [Steroidobacteraceae bacterium]